MALFADKLHAVTGLELWHPVEQELRVVALSHFRKLAAIASRDGTHHFFEDIPLPPRVAPLNELNVADGFLAFITGDAAHANRDRFAALIGPVSGPDVR